VSPRNAEGATTYRCPRCIERGQTWPGDPPKCSFTADGVFTRDGWNCATMAVLRDYAASSAVWSEDQYAAVLPFDGEHLVLSWYKHRGRTDVALVLHDYGPEPLTLEAAEEWIGLQTKPPEPVDPTPLQVLAVVAMWGEE
jgi:hypothetical protein